MVEYYEDYTIMQIDNFIIGSELIGVSYFCDIRLDNFDNIHETINYINLN
jgi:hypothetical protein